MRRCKFLLMLETKRQARMRRTQTRSHCSNDNNDDSNKSDSYTVLDHTCALYTRTKMKVVARAMIVGVTVFPTILVSKYVKNSRSRSN